MAHLRRKFILLLIIKPLFRFQRISRLKLIKARQTGHHGLELIRQEITYLRFRKDRNTDIEIKNLQQTLNLHSLVGLSIKLPGNGAVTVHGVVGRIQLILNRITEM